MLIIGKSIQIAGSVFIRNGKTVIRPAYAQTRQVVAETYETVTSAASKHLGQMSVGQMTDVGVSPAYAHSDHKLSGVTTVTARRASASRREGHRARRDGAHVSIA